MLEHLIQCHDLGVIGYADALSIQKKALDIIRTDDKHPDCFYLLEHLPVFTLGKNGGRENLLKKKAFLQQQNIGVVKTERGGNITYHGPGQLVCYPVFNLERFKMGIKTFVWLLEEVMIRTIADLGVTGTRSDINHGIWVGKQKVGSIGLAVKQQITMHGFALNIDMDLKPFSWIHPCGLKNTGISSIKEELLRSGQKEINLCLNDIKQLLLGHLKVLFKAELIFEDTNKKQIYTQTGVA